jgi:hypothetical protein
VASRFAWRSYDTEAEDFKWSSLHLISIAAITLTLFPLLFVGGTAWTLFTSAGADAALIKTGGALWRNEL